MDRVAVLVDAGYFFAAGSALVGGGEKAKRSLITLDVPATVTALKQLATKVTGGRALLRIYWYDGASARSGPTTEHSRIAHCDDVKLRLGFLNAHGQQKGVDSLIVTDLVELARNGAISDAVLISGDEDVRIGVVLAQGFGVRVHLVAVHPGRGTQSPQLRQEADTSVEWGLEDIKPLISVKREKAPVPEDIAPLPDMSSAGARHVSRAAPAATPVTAAQAAVAASAASAPTAIQGIDAVVTALLTPLTESERQGLVQYMQANGNSIPAEFDGKLLARSRTTLGRDLQPTEKSYARTRFRRAAQRA